MCAMELRMCPDSGHHYFFIPLVVANSNKRMRDNVIASMPESDPRKAFLEAGNMQDDFYNALAKIGQGDIDPWHECDWDEKLGWIRYRLGYQDTRNKARSSKLLGVWLAMESNIGDFSRGTVEKKTLPSEVDMEKFEAGQLKDSPNPYVFSADDARNLDKMDPIDFRPYFKQILEHILDGKGLNASLPVVWGEIPKISVIWIPAKGNTINVDLIIDFGNTRSAVLSLITNQKTKFDVNSTGSILNALTFVDETDQFWDAEVKSDGLVDSFFALREPMFNNFHEVATVYDILKENKQVGFLFNKRNVESKKLLGIKTFHPQKFVQLAPTAIGPAVEAVLNEDFNQRGLQDGGSYVQSSPKRYYWDNDPHGHGGEAWWNMFDRTWSNPGRTSMLRPLQCDMLAYCPMNGSDWSLNNPPTSWPAETVPSSHPGKATYPRSDTMTWMALSILEIAYRQLNSPRFNSNNMPYIPRRFNGVYLTYPSGWTNEEKEMFRSKWQKAMNIFCLSQLASVEDCPKVVLEIDEAVASQLPYVYSEIENLEGRESGKKSSELWLEQVGRPDGGGTLHARIMTLDIGGGTADTSIIEYTEKNKDPKNPLKNLNAELLFKDSESTAGDILVKCIIEKVLLPSIVGGDSALLHRWNKGQKQGEISQKQIILRQVLIPIVRFWMGRLSMGLENPFVSESGFCFSADEMHIEAENWNMLMNVLGLNMDSHTPILVTQQQLADCIADVFGGKFIQKMAKIAVAFGVDVIVICGKVSELPELKKLFERFLPLGANRLVFMKDYYAGNWYPAVYSDGGCIRDPKTATVSGAALYHAFTQNMIIGWKLDYDDSNFNGRNNWRWKKSNENFMFRDSDEDQVTLQNIQVGDIICRSKFNTGFSAEPVYMLRLKQWLTRKGNCTLDSVTFRRVNIDNVERLELVDADGVFSGYDGHTERVGLSDLELILHPMEVELNWQESTLLDLQ